MPYEQRDNTGALFVNDKEGNEKRADRRGSATIDGVQYWVNGWLKKTKNGDPWLSLSFQKKVRDQFGDMTGGQKAAPEMNDEIPF